ncbi:uncharacterized protein LOC143182529 [Calliopsis andreniformis]|uniref:uncharacterized protein LOC143182529 n=1 Tax=Calliopsis andreniformis TaxID=337506 RepID=UPI003FCE53A3
MISRSPQLFNFQTAVVSLRVRDDAPFTIGKLGISSSSRVHRGFSPTTEETDGNERHRVSVGCPVLDEAQKVVNAVPEIRKQVILARLPAFSSEKNVKPHLQQPLTCQTSRTSLLEIKRERKTLENFLYFFHFPAS